MDGKAIARRHDQMRFKSPSIVIPHMEDLGKQITILRQKNYRLEALKKMIEDDKVEVPNLDAEVLFDPNNKKKVIANYVKRRRFRKQKFLIICSKNVLKWASKLRHRETPGDTIIVGL